MKRLVLGLTLVAFAIALLPSAASAAPEITAAFVGCDENAEEPQPSHKCLTTDHPAGFFESSEAIEYEFCLFEGVEELACGEPTSAAAATPFEDPFEAAAGSYDAVWFIAGTSEELAEWAITIEEPPPPPPPPVVVPVVPPVVAPVLPPVNTECLAAQRRVTRLKGQVKKAHGAQKAKLKTKLKKARGAVKAAC
jgi:hypothetical protein